MIKKNIPTIPAPQNIKRREAYLLTHADKLPTTYVQAQLLKLAMVRSEKNLRWGTSAKPAEDRETRMVETAKTFKKKQGFVGRVKGMFKSQRGN